MKKLYKDVKVPVTFDDSDYYRSKLSFVSNKDVDGEYLYEFDDEIDMEYYDNNLLIAELHVLFNKFSPKKLLVDFFDDIELSNYCCDQSVYFILF